MVLDMMLMFREVFGFDRRFDNVVVGVAGGLSKTRVTSVDGHSGEADSLQSTVYASYFTDRFYLNARMSFASSDVETDGVSSFGYRSEYDAKNLSFFVGAGVGYKGFNDALIITPISYCHQNILEMDIRVLHR